MDKDIRINMVADTTPQKKNIDLSTFLLLHR